MNRFFYILKRLAFKVQHRLINEETAMYLFKTETKSDTETSIEYFIPSACFNTVGASTGTSTAASTQAPLVITFSCRMLLPHWILNNLTKVLEVQHFSHVI